MGGASGATWLVVGLGNPGARYARSWHNCGFRVLELLAQETGIRIRKIRFKGLYGRGRMDGVDVVLLLPTTYMNLSGESVGEAMRYFRIPAERVLVLYDDIDFPAGSVRIRKSGGAGSHNGMKSVLTHVGTREFPRVRIGVGPAPEDADLADFVLSAIPDEQRETMSQAFARAADAVRLVVTEGVERAMNRIHTP